MANKTHHCSSIDEAIAILREGITPHPSFPDLEEHAYQWVTNGDRAQLVPTLVQPFLYRGQAERHAPCLPAVFRGLKPADRPQNLTPVDRARLLLHRVRLEEFLCVLDAHPASAFARDLPLVTYPEAIAQHYEMLTDRIDLSQDIDVAAFFATNTRDENGRWREIESGKGVLYRLRIPPDVFRPPFKGLEWIGRQALPRPGEQRAWTLRLPLGRDFETLPVDIYTFDHHPDCGQRFLEKFRGGKALFPPDVLSALAAQIRNAPTVSRTILNRVLMGYGVPSDRPQQERLATEFYFQDKFGISTTDRDALAFSPTQLAAAQEATAALARCFKGVVRAVRTGESLAR